MGCRGRGSAGGEGGGRRPACGWEEVEHTADLAFRAWAVDLSGLFAQAAGALLSLMADTATVNPAQARLVHARGSDETDTLIRFLNEIIYASSAEGMLFCSAEDVVASDEAARAVLRGEPYDPSVHEILAEIKAATYHGAQVARRGGVWEVTVILDT